MNNSLYLIVLIIILILFLTIFYFVKKNNKIKDLNYKGINLKPKDKIFFKKLILRIHLFKKRNKKNKIKNLEEFDKVMKKNNLFYWIGEGTALGAIRNKDIINNDSDVDVGIYDKDFNKFKKYVIPDLLKNKFKIGRLQPFSIYKNNEYIDIDITGNNLKCMAYNYPTNCNYHIKDIKPFRFAYINKKKYNVPSIKYIEKLYGKNWRIPSNKKPSQIKA